MTRPRPNLLTCSCGASVSFTEEDRGFEVFCTCGKSLRVPAVEAEPAGRTSESVEPPAPRRRSVFDGGAAVERKVVGEVVCLCGTKVPVRVEDYGGTVWCPSCGAEVQVGQGLARQPAAAGRSVLEDSLPRPTPVPRMRFLRSRWAIAAMLLIAALAAGGGYFVWASRIERPPVVADRPPPTPAPAQPDTTGEAPPFDPDLVTPESIDALLDEEDPFQALLSAHNVTRGLVDSGVSPDDPRFARLKAVARQVIDAREQEMLDLIHALDTEVDAQAALDKSIAWTDVLTAYEVPATDERLAELSRIGALLVERAAPITVEMIGELLTWPDPAEAIVKARLWHMDLEDRDVPPGDSRFARLEEVIRALEERLVPPPRPEPACLAEFARVVQDLSRALLADDLSAAPQARDEAERLLRQFPDDLAPLAGRYTKLKAQLRQREFQQGGVGQVEELLTRAEAAVAAPDGDRAGEAIDWKAQAKFLALLTPLKPDQAERLSQRVKVLSPRVRFARALRAIGDARRADRAGDTATRGREARRAWDLLQGLPESEVRPHVEQVAAWREAGQASDAQASSARAFEIDHRELFEQALEHYGDAQPGPLLKACLAADLAAERANQPDSRRRLGELLFDVLDWELARPPRPEETDAGRGQVARLVQVRKLWDAATPWKETVRWRALDDLVRQQGAALAEEALARAVELSESDEINRAIAELETAVLLGTSDVSRQARQLDKELRAELAARRDQSQEERTWLAITKQSTDPERLLETCRALQKFLERYPQGRYAEQAGKLYARLQADAERLFTQKLADLATLLDQRDWHGAVELYGMLESAATTPEQRAALADAESRLAETERLALHEFQLLGTRRTMGSPADTVAARRAAARVLIFQPGHADARELYDKAVARGAVQAPHILAEAKRMKTSHPKYRERLMLIVALDPRGEHGQAAQALLDQL